MPAELYFRVLGPLVVERAGEQLNLGSPQRRAVLATLLMHANQVVSVDWLADVLWGDRPPASHRVQLQSLVSGLRRLLVCPDGRTVARIVTQPPGYRLQVPEDRLDLARFRVHLGTATALRESGAYDRAADVLQEALALWRGRAFADIPYAAVQRAAEPLDELRVAGLEDRVDAQIEAGRTQGLIPELTQLVADHPGRERLHAHLMTLLARAGRPADALAAYRSFRRWTVEELGIEPSRPLQELYREILLGNVGYDETEVAVEVVQPRVVPRLLPAAVPVLVGRDAMLTTVAALFAGGVARSTPACVALTGPGGIGKTASAVYLAHRLLDDFPDGQLYLSLGGVRGDRLAPEAALARLLRALGVPAAAVPTGADERATLLRDLLAGRRVLLVLDDVADEAQLRPLLPGGPGCAVLVTSRRRLAGIDVLRSVPLDVLAIDEGVALLATTAGADRVAAELPAARELVRHCGGLPLAIQVAGARLATRPNWTVKDLAGRLARVRERLDWLEVGDIGIRTSLTEGYAGLAPEQRRLFRRLGLVDCAEFPAWVAGALLDGGSGRAERLLEDLVDVHLVEPAGRGLTGPRYRMHDLVRLVARERAVDEESAPATGAALGRVLHGWYALSTLADAQLSRWFRLDPAPAPAWQPPEEIGRIVRAQPLAWFDEERGVLGVAVRQAADERHPEVAWPLAQCLATYLERRWRVDEWRDAVRHGLRAAEEASDRRGEASMLRLLVEVEGHLDQFDTSLRRAERALAVYRALGDSDGEADMLARIAAFHRISGELPQALDEHERALALARRVGNPLTIGFAAYTLGIARRFAGDHDVYPALFEEARAAFRAGGARSGEAEALNFIGLAHLHHGRLADAEECLLGAREILRALEHDIGVPYCEIDLARVYSRQGRFAEAEKLAADVLGTMRLHRQQFGIGRALLVVGGLAHAAGDRRTAFDSYLEALSIWRRVGQRIRVAQTLFALAEICEHDGDGPAAVAYRAEYRPMLDRLGITERELAAEVRYAAAPPAS